VCSELRQLMAMQRQIEQGALQAGAAATSPSAGKGVSLYHNVLSPAPALSGPGFAATTLPAPGPRGARGQTARASPHPAVSVGAPGAARGVGGPAARRTLRHDKPSSQLPARTIAAPTPPVLTPHSQVRDAYSGSTTPAESGQRRQPMGGSIFDLLAPKNKGPGGAQSPPRSAALDVDRFDAVPAVHAAARRVSSPRVHPMPVEVPLFPSNSNHLVNNYTDPGRDSGPVRMTLHVPSTATSAAVAVEGIAPPSSWTTRDGARFTPPESPRRAFPRSPPTFLTAALDTDSEESAQAHAQHEPASHARGELLSQYVARGVPGATSASQDSSPDSQAYSEQQPASTQDMHRHAAHADHYYYPQAEEEGFDEGSSFDGEGLDVEGEDIDEAEFRADSNDSQRDY
jgi:hypothetical protein